MNKYLVNILVVVVVILAFNSCKKDYMNAPSSFQTMSGEADMSKYIGIWDASRPIRNTNPYSIATIREVKSILAGFENEDIAAIGNSTLNSSNYQLYCRIDIENTDNNIVLNQWLADDSNRTVVDFPLDSVAMYPEIFEEAGIADNFYQTKYAYTTVWLGDELPTGAEIIDTLYVPNSAENQDDLFLDFMAHILTSNISPASMKMLDDLDTAIVGNIGRAVEVTLRRGTAAKPLLEEYVDPANLVVPPMIWEVGGRLYHNIQNYGSGDGNGLSATGSIAFWENEKNEWEGIRKVRVKLVHFTLLTASTHIYNSDDYGNFNTPNLMLGAGTIMFEFANNKVKVADIDVRHVISVWSLLNLPFAARHIKFYFATQPDNITVRYGHGSKSALWGIIMNGVQEANKYAVDENLRSNISASPHLTVYAAYKNSEWDAGNGSAPMFSQGDHNVNLASALESLLDITTAAPVATSFTTLPDLIICQSANSPQSSRQLRHTIYHEYGHALHYFRVAGSGLWRKNVLASVSGDGYGTAIDESPGDMFALTEGWADYVAHSFAAKKYPAANFREWTWNTEGTMVLYDATASYNTHLENNPTFFNSFIPRGLFYDLTDADRPEEDNFDRINGFTMRNIYDRLGNSAPNLIPIRPIETIQEFREVWEAAFPNPDNEDLFNEYNVE